MAEAAGPDTGALLTIGDGVTVTAPALVANLLTDLLVAGAYVAVLFIIVYLNRHRYISIFVPGRTYALMFGLVFGVNVAASAAALIFPHLAVTLVYKIVTGLFMLAIVVAVWRVLPRDIDVHERHRLRLAGTTRCGVFRYRRLSCR